MLHLIYTIQSNHKLERLIKLACLLHYVAIIFQTSIVRNYKHCYCNNISESDLFPVGSLSRCLDHFSLSREMIVMCFMHHPTRNFWCLGSSAYFHQQPVVELGRCSILNAVSIVSCSLVLLLVRPFLRLLYHQLELPSTRGLDLDAAVS